MARWEPRFEFYFSDRDGCRFSTDVDLDARKHAPMESHPVVLRARVLMHDPRPDGLRSAAEAPALFAFEDRLVARLGEALDAVYVGRVVGDGRTEFLFYVPHSTETEPAAAVADLEPYTISFTRVLDRSWLEYGELYPDDRQWHQIRDRRLLDTLEEKGDQPDVPRQVDHLVLFEDRPSAESAARILADRGFAFFTDPVTERNGRFAVEFHRAETCRPSDVQRFVEEILESCSR
jgi:uncharacterized protein DUF695/regulator of ribonuclease activity B